jgi:hypothetical protein
VGIVLPRVLILNHLLISIPPFRTTAGFSDASHEPHVKHAPSPV